MPVCRSQFLKGMRAVASSSWRLRSIRQATMSSRITATVANNEPASARFGARSTGMAEAAADKTANTMAAGHVALKIRLKLEK